MSPFKALPFTFRGFQLESWRLEVRRADVCLTKAEQLSDRTHEFMGSPGRSASGSALPQAPPGTAACFELTVLVLCPPPLGQLLPSSGLPWPHPPCPMSFLSQEPVSAGQVSRPELLRLQTSETQPCWITVRLLSYYCRITVLLSPETAWKNHLKPWS